MRLGPAFLLAAFACSPAALPAQPPNGGPRQTSYAMVARSPETGRVLDALVADLNADGAARLVRGRSPGPDYGSCLAGSPEGQAIASCVAERLRAGGAGRPALALLAVDGPGGPGDATLWCVGDSSLRLASLRDSRSANPFLRDEARRAIVECLSGASPGAAVSRPIQASRGPVRSLRTGPEFRRMPVEQAQRLAGDVVSLVVKEADVPDARSGACTLAGYVGSVERGSAFATGDRLRIPLPCTANGGLESNRTASMGALRNARISLVYLSAAGTVLDVAPDAMCEYAWRIRGLRPWNARTRCESGERPEDD